VRRKCAGFRIAADRRETVQHKVDIVFVIAAHVRLASTVAVRKIGVVVGARAPIDGYHLSVVAQAVVNMSGHVFEMGLAGLERERREIIGVGARPIGPVRLLPKVDAQMMRADVVGIECQCSV
jgi:hypothetical protein